MQKVIFDISKSIIFNLIYVELFIIYLYLHEILVFC